MPPVRRIRSAAAALLLVAGCGTVEFEAPPGHKVRLLEVDEPTTIQAERKVWYALWGNEPLGDNSTASMIEENDLSEVRMATEQTIIDNIISSVTVFFSFSVRTVYVEGNR